jgi:hypothetical protein
MFSFEVLMRASKVKKPVELICMKGKAGTDEVFSALVTLF